MTRVGYNILTKDTWGFSDTLCSLREYGYFAPCRNGDHLKKVTIVCGYATDETVKADFTMTGFYEASEGELVEYRGAFTRTAPNVWEWTGPLLEMCNMYLGAGPHVLLDVPASTRYDINYFVPTIDYIFVEYTIGESSDRAARLKRIPQYKLRGVEPWVPTMSYHYRWVPTKFPGYVPADAPHEDVPHIKVYRSLLDEELAKAEGLAAAVAGPADDTPAAAASDTPAAEN